LCVVWSWSPQGGRAKEKALISIQSAMFLALGFLAASLLGLLLASAFWSRAVRLTTARIKQSLPVSEQEIQADRDRLRAEYAIKVHKLETHLEQAKLTRARQLVELNRRDANISSLETNLGALKAELEQQQNARHVLEQTVADRLPKVEARLAEAKRLILSREREIAEMVENSKRQKLALEEAASINAQQTAQIERLTSAIVPRGGKPAGESASDAEGALRSELEALRAKARDQANVIDRLQRNASAPQGLAPLGRGAGEETAKPAQEVLAQAETALASARAGASGADQSAALERELRALRTRAEDQAGEITRLKAALASFEANDRTEGGKESRVSLSARLGSAQAHAEHQSAMIGRLRAELAAVNERLARQAAHFMEEMRRLGAGSMPVAAQPRPASPRADRRPLAERVAHVRQTTPEATSPAQAGEPQVPAKGEDAPLPPRNGGAGAETQSAPSSGAAAELPKAGDIPVEGRRLRLLDRITSLAKE
jgi:hypothetical protein